MLKKKSKECRSYVQEEWDGDGDPNMGGVCLYCELSSGHEGPHQVLYQNYASKGRWLKISWQNKGRKKDNRI